MNIGLLDPNALIVEDEEEFVEMPLEDALEALKPIKGLTLLVGESHAGQVTVKQTIKNFSFDTFEEED